MNTLALDQESAEWLRAFQRGEKGRDDAIARLHALLRRVSRAEVSRRRALVPGQTPVDVDDHCVQATHDAVMAILAKLDTYRGDARFTTWAC